MYLLKIIYSQKFSSLQNIVSSFHVCRIPARSPDCAKFAQSCCCCLVGSLACSWNLRALACSQKKTQRHSTILPLLALGTRRNSVSSLQFAGQPPTGIGQLAISCKYSSDAPSLKICRNSIHRMCKKSRDNK